MTIKWYLNNRYLSFKKVKGGADPSRVETTTDPTEPSKLLVSWTPRWYGTLQTLLLEWF